MKLDPVVAQVIVSENIDNFTTSDVRARYISISKDSSINRSTLRRKIYAELIKLVRKGWLDKIISEKKGLTRFSKTKKFDAEDIKSKYKFIISLDNNKEKHDQLLDKLNQYKTELLMNIGESEAYKEIYSEFPELVGDIQPQYNKARDNHTKLLGKIRAVEGLLEQDKSTENNEITTMARKLRK